MIVSPFGSLAAGSVIEYEWP